MNDYTNISTFDSNAAALAIVLKNWRTSHGYSLYKLAKFENCRIEVMQHVEEGSGNMSSLLLYLDFIRCNDRPFLDRVMSEWCKQCGYES